MMKLFSRLSNHVITRQEFWKYFSYGAHIFFQHFQHSMLIAKLQQKFHKNAVF